MHLNPDDPPADEAKATAAWKALLASTFVRVVIAESEYRIVSTCTLVIVPNVTRGVRPYAQIENVVADRAFRRKGLGGAVLAKATQMVCDARCYKVTPATGSKNPETLRFYEGAGFSRGEKTLYEARPRSWFRIIELCPRLNRML